MNLIRGIIRRVEGNVLGSLVGGRRNSAMAPKHEKYLNKASYSNEKKQPPTRASLRYSGATASNIWLVGPTTAHRFVSILSFYSFMCHFVALFET